MNVSLPSVTALTRIAKPSPAVGAQAVIELGLQAQFISKDLTLSPADRDAQLKALSQRAKLFVAQEQRKSEAAVNATLVDSTKDTGDAVAAAATSHGKDADGAADGTTADGSNAETVTYARTGEQGAGDSTDVSSKGTVVDVHV